MAFSTRPFIEDLRAQIAQVWPDVLHAGGGVIDAERINMEEWKRLTLPFAVILIESLPRADWGVANLAFQPPVTVWRVDATEGNSDGLTDQLDALISHFWPVSPLTEGQCIDIGDVSWSDDLYPNQVFRAANRSQRAGMVTLNCVFGIDNQ